MGKKQIPNNVLLFFTELNSDSRRSPLKVRFNGINLITSPDGDLMSSVSVHLAHLKEDYENWIKGIRFLADTYSLSYSQKIDIWNLRTFETLSDGDLCVEESL